MKISKVTLGKELICNHNPCLVALLEIKMTIHIYLKDEFAFDNYIEVPAIGNLGDMVLMCFSHVLQVSLNNRTD